jgi:carbonic anhydrase/acetyltransferase-like protein (isoleucine patch superfamily)
MPLQQPKKHVPIQIGAYTVIGRDCQLEAAAIGSLCCIGDNVTAGERSIVKDCCVIAGGTKIPADMVVPPFTHLSSVNGSLVTTELPPAAAVELQERAMECYQEFVATERKLSQR